MNWNLVEKDPYYRSRAIEAKARNENSVENWQEFADLKASKGSYVLAAHGYLSGALLCEQQKHAEQAFDLLAKAFQYALRAGSKELALIVAYHHAALAERLERWSECIEVYESLGKYCEEHGSFFLAADAFEHAAEIMAKSGMPVASYTRPVELWERNALYWQERRQEDDAGWSERHIGLYKLLFQEQQP